MPTIDLSQLPSPTIIEALDFETILIEVKAVMVAAFPEDQQAAVAAALTLESEPLTIIAQAMTYRELLLRQRINEGAAACMLSHATGDDLDNIAANLDTERLVITAATDTADAVTEGDEALRLRAQAAFEIPAPRWGGGALRARRLPMSILPAAPAARSLMRGQPARHRQRWWWLYCLQKAMALRRRRSWRLLLPPSMTKKCAPWETG